MINRQLIIHLFLADGGAVACFFNSCRAAISLNCVLVLGGYLTIQYMHNAKCVGGTRGQYRSTVQFCPGAQHMVLLCHGVVGVVQA